MPKRDPSPTPVEESPAVKRSNDNVTFVENAPAIAMTETYEARLARLTQELANLIERVQREKAEKDAKTLAGPHPSRSPRSPNR
jgi:hypothetical protein